MALPYRFNLSEYIIDATLHTIPNIIAIAIDAPNIPDQTTGSLLVKIVSVINNSKNSIINR